METETTNHQDVAEPDQIVSGTAGTGQEHRISTGTTKTRGGAFGERGRPARSGRPERTVIGLGVLYNGTARAGAGAAPLQDPKNGGLRSSDQQNGEQADGPRPDSPEGVGDLVFSLYECQERIADRLNRKIVRLEQRLEKFEDRSGS